MADNRDFMKYWAVVRYYVMKKYQLKQQDMELLFFLKSEKYFSKTTCHEYNNLLAWEPYRFEKLVKAGWIGVYRKRTKSEWTIYTLTLKCKAMLNSVYDMMQGERVPAYMVYGKDYMPRKKMTTREKLHRDFMVKIKEETEELKRQQQ